MSCSPLYYGRRALGKAVNQDRQSRGVDRGLGKQEWIRRRDLSGIIKYGGLVGTILDIRLYCLLYLAVYGVCEQF